MRERVLHAVIFADQVELFGFNTINTVGALVGDVPGALQVFATATETESEKAVVLGLIGAGFEEVDLIGAHGEDAEGGTVKIDNARGSGRGLVIGADVIEDGSHLLGGPAAFDEDRAGLDVVVVYNAGVVIGL